MPVLFGTELLTRYPHLKGSTLKGIPTYGTVKQANGTKAWRIAANEAQRASIHGYAVIAVTKSYATVAPFSRIATRAIPA